MPRTPGEWRTESVSDAVRVVVGTGRQKIILARLAPRQIPEMQTHANAKLMALAPRLATTLVSIVEAGILSGHDHPIDICRCGNCSVRRLARTVKELNG